MSTQTIQGQLWSTAPTDWANHFEPWFLPIYTEVLEKFKLNDAHVLLDAGCGSGLFSHMAIKNGAQVIGIDAAPGLLEIARERNPDHIFLEEDLEGLVFADASFDFVVAFNSLQYAGSFEKALEEAVRVLKPGGKLALAIWDKPENSDAVHVLKAISSLLPPPLPGTPGPFALSEDGRIEAACKLAGLHVETKQVIACPFVYKSLNEGVKSFIGTGPAAAALNSNREEVVIDAITNALAPFKLADDIHFMVNKYLLFVATKL